MSTEDLRYGHEADHNLVDTERDYLKAGDFDIEDERLFRRGERAGWEGARTRSTHAEFDRLLACMPSSCSNLRAAFSIEQCIFLASPERAADHEAAMQYWLSMLDGLESLSDGLCPYAHRDFQAGFFAGLVNATRAVFPKEDGCHADGRMYGVDWALDRATPEELQHLLRAAECFDLGEEFQDTRSLDDRDFVRMHVCLAIPPSSEGLMAWWETWVRMLEWPVPNPFDRKFVEGFLSAAVELARESASTDVDPGPQAPERPESTESPPSAKGHQPRGIPLRRRPNDAAEGTS